MLNGDVWRQYLTACTMTTCQQMAPRFGSPHPTKTLEIYSIQITILLPAGYGSVTFRLASVSQVEPIVHWLERPAASQPI
jgi:hypothetical protein